MSASPAARKIGSQEPGYSVIDREGQLLFRQSSCVQKERLEQALQHLKTVHTSDNAPNRTSGTQEAGTSNHNSGLRSLPTMFMVG